VAVFRLGEIFALERVVAQKVGADQGGGDVGDALHQKEKERMFFFEKKNQKTFAPWRTWPISKLVAHGRSKSFLLLFFKKEDLACFFTLSAS
jgi:hypothetical protein